LDDRKFGEKVSDAVARFGGSWKFIILFALFLITWIIVNSLHYLEYIAFDKKPFILLNLILSFIAAFQAPFIMMSQNRTEKKQDEAYRILFREIKELVEQDIEYEQEIKNLSSNTQKELDIVKAQLIRLFNTLQQAISLENLTRKDIAEILQHYDEEDNAK
jgi:uncharacterized membrane protein